MKVIKSNGEIEEFRADKLVESLVRSGASLDDAQKIAQMVESRFQGVVTTRVIYSLAKDLLKRINYKYASRYSLKKALMRLGPSGYPFERFFAKILEAYGYETQIDIVEHGMCISHEIDVLALKDDTVVSVECKYHSSAGRASDSKVAMYVNSRFMDLAEKLKAKYKKEKFEGWLVTNTRFTSEAKRFAKCYGFKTIGWRYPQDGSLEKMLEEKHLFPITVLIGIKQELLKKLLENGIVLVRQFLSMDDETLENFGFNRIKIKHLKNQARELLTPI